MIFYLILFFLSDKKIHFKFWGFCIISETFDILLDEFSVSSDCYYMCFLAPNVVQSSPIHIVPAAEQKSQQSLFQYFSGLLEIIIHTNESI